MNNETKGKANPDTYRKNIVNTIKETGDTINPSPNACKLELLNPEAILCYESKYKGLKGASLSTVANKHSVSERTVRTYYSIYKELRDTGELTEEDIEVYLNSNGKDYPLEPLPELPPENKLLLILEQQDTIINKLQSLNQTQATPLELQEEFEQRQLQQDEITKLREEIDRLNATIQSQQETIQQQQETISKITNENETFKQAALKATKQLNNQTKDNQLTVHQQLLDNSVTVHRQLTDIHQTVKQLEVQTNEILIAKQNVISSKALSNIYTLAVEASNYLSNQTRNLISLKSLSPINDTVFNLLERAGGDTATYKYLCEQSQILEVVSNRIELNGLRFRSKVFEIERNIRNLNEVLERMTIGIKKQLDNIS